MPKEKDEDQLDLEEENLSIEEEEIEVPPDLLERWQGVVDTLAEVADTPAGLIMKADPPYIEVFRSSRTDGNPYEVGDREKLTGLYCEEVIESGESLLVKDAREDEDWNENPDLKLGMVNYFGYPLSWPNGNPFGTICILDREKRDYDEDTRELLERFKELVETQLALLYKNRKLSRKTEELLETQRELKISEEKLRKLHAAVDEFQRCETESSLCKAATEVTEDLLNSVDCIFYCVQEEGLVPVAATEEVDIDGTPSPEPGEGIVDKALKQGQTITGDDQEELDNAALFKTDPKSYMGVPIGKLGVFQVVSKQKGAFDQTDVQLAEILAGHLNEEVKRIRLEEKLRERAIKDPLTDLYNRRYLNETLKKEVERSERYGYNIAFLMLDVNGFKEINDRYSHQTGDEVLREIADILEKNVRDADTVVRYGGDEFLIMLPETNGKSKNAVKRLKNELSRWNQKSELLDFPLTLAIGISHWNPDQDRDVEAALKEADRKMYEDKKEEEG